MIGTQTNRPDPEWMQPRDEDRHAPLQVIHNLPNWLLFVEVAFIAVHSWGLFGL